MTTTKTSATEVATFQTLKQAITRRFNELIDSTSQGNQLFIAAVSKDVLWDTYLATFPEGTNPVYKIRREYDCSTCRHFIMNLGGLISVSQSGEVTSLWSGLSRTLPYPFNVVTAMQACLLSTAAIDRPFLTTEMRYGVDKNYAHPDGGPVEIWEHFFAKIPSAFVRTATQIGSELSELRASHDVLLRALKELDLETIDSVLDLIRQGSLYRGEEKLHDLTAFRAVRAEFAALETDLAARYRHGEWGVDIARAAEYAERQRDNFAWVRSTTLPGSVSRIRNTSLGTLLVDLAEGTDLDAAVGKYEAIMAPTREDRCFYCDQAGTDHNHGTGRSCGDCCGMHGMTLHEGGQRVHEWIKHCLKAKNAAIADAATLLAERDMQLAAQTALVETLRTALELARSKMVHYDIRCLPLLPTEQWTAESGNRSAHCCCGVGIVDAALVAAGKGE